MTAVAWFLTSLIACAIGACIALFAVTTRDNLNAWVATLFICGALVNLTLIIVFTAKPA